MEQATTVAKAEPRVHYGLIVLATIVLAVFGALGLARFGYTSILPSMQEGLKLTNTQTGELQSWNLFGYMLAVVLAGVLAARYGPRVVISVSLLIAAAAMISTGLFPTFEAARLGRFFGGVGGAGGNVPAMGLVSAWFGTKRRGLASGVAVAGSSFGLMLTGPLIPAILLQYGADGWRISWYVLGAIAVGVFVLCVLFLRNRPEEMGLIPLGDSQAESDKRASDKKASSLDWGLVYKSPLLWQLSAIYFAFGFSYLIYSTFFVRYLTREASMGVATAGNLWLWVGIISTISGFIWGGLSDRWGRRTSLVAVFVLQGASFLIFGFSRELSAIYLSAALFAITAWSIPALMGALAGDIFGARLAPAAIGLMTIVFSSGQVIAPYFAGAVADATQSFALAFVAGGIVSLLGALGAFVVRTPKRAT